MVLDPLTPSGHVRVCERPVLPTERAILSYQRLDVHASSFEQRMYTQIPCAVWIVGTIIITKVVTKPRHDHDHLCLGADRGQRSGNSFYFYFFYWRTKASQDKAMQRQTSTNQRDPPGQDTGRSQGHLI